MTAPINSVNEQAKLIFVDCMGNKVLEKNLKKFVTELKNDQSRIINDHSIFEYALSMVILSIATREQSSKKMLNQSDEAGPSFQRPPRRRR